MTFPAPKGTTGVRNQTRKDVNSLEDAKIIDLFWARKEEAIHQTDKAYGRRLHVLADRILNNREDAQECVNDTYLRAWQVMPPQRPDYLYAFLASICRHVAFHKLDWKLAAKRHAEVVALTEELEMCIPDTRGEQELEDREMGRILNAFLETLPRESRQIFLRRYWHADSIAQIAARYGMTQSKVKMQLSRTRAKLCTYLEQEGVKV